jgi:transcriptional/translational regulatory protein YebC/TACO1
MTRNGGTMADPGSVSYLFARKGVVIVPKGQDGRTVDEDALLEVVLEAGADDVEDLGESFEVRSEAGDLVPVRSAIQAAGLDYESADSSWLPSVTVPLDAPAAEKVFRLLDVLEDCDDVQNVYANFDVSDDVMAAVST